MKRLFYFAFGSNMLSKRLADRVDHLGAVSKHANYRLQGYELVFNCGGFQKTSFANIVESHSSNFVEGVLYELNDEQISVLNRYEGYPFNYQQRFFVLPDGNIGFAYVSTTKLYRSHHLPAIEYLNICIAGALENGLIETYNKLVDFKNKNYTLKKGNKFKKK